MDTTDDDYFALSRQLVVPDDRPLRRRMRLLFDGIPLRGRSLLDVGGGSGLMSFYAASKGASPVVCLEPADAGSNPAMGETFSRWQVGLKVHVELVRQTFQELDPAETRYDVILVHNAINHMDEDACRRLPDDPEARRRYVSMFKKLADLTTPGGHLVVADAARKNAWGAAGLRSPFAPTIEWDIHAQPRTWAQLAEEAGFGNSSVQWRSHDRLGAAGQRLLGNPVGGWLTNSSFILHMRRAA